MVETEWYDDMIDEDESISDRDRSLKIEVQLRRLTHRFHYSGILVFPSDGIFWC